MAIFAMEWFFGGIVWHPSQRKEEGQEKDDNEHSKGDRCMAPIFAMEWFFGGIVWHPSQRMEDGRGKG
jgi:hypothetical protein